MSVGQKLLVLFCGVGGLLLLASLIGFILARRVRSETARATVENLNERIRAWWVMVAIMALGILFGRGATLLLFTLVSFYTLREFVSLMDTRLPDHSGLIAAFYVLLPLQYYLLWIDWYGLFAVMIPVYGFLILPSIAALRGCPQNFLLRVAGLQWALMLTVYCISHAPALVTLDIPGYEGQGFLLLFFLVAVVQFSDVMQYVFGKLFGSRKLAPTISPSKTVEGLAGGALSAVVAGAALYWVTPFTAWQAAAAAFVIVTMGFLGGLSLSAMKRSLGAKDWGTQVKGHGGVLDRMDSVSFAAPVFFHLTRYFFTP